MSNKGLGKAVHLVHLFLAEALPPDGVAIDATAGNGYDTLFLARQVGAGGQVYAFDLQEQALRATGALLAAHGAARQVRLLRQGHEGLGQTVPPPVDAVIFNLGYLPGGRHDLITKPKTTLQALEASIRLLRPGGRIGLVGYPGHPGGLEEMAVLEDFAAALDQGSFSAVKLSYLNRSARAPVLILIEKAGGPDESQATAKNP